MDDQPKKIIAKIETEGMIVESLARNSQLEEKAKELLTRETVAHDMISGIAKAVEELPGQLPEKVKEQIQEMGSAMIQPSEAATMAATPPAGAIGAGMEAAVSASVPEGDSRPDMRASQQSMTPRVNRQNQPQTPRLAGGRAKPKTETKAPASNKKNWMIGSAALGAALSLGFLTWPS